jgi:FKBP-type peptidyl-prolyl cis-trans isomerase 2
VHGATVAVHYVISLHATGVVIDRTFAEEIAKDDADAAAQVQAEDQRDNEEGEEEGEEEVDRKPFMFRMGRPGIIKGMQRAVASMQLNEHAEFIVAPELAYGATGNPPKVPANAELRLNVELVSFTTEEKVWDSEGLSKTFLELGTGHNRPNEDAEVVVDFEVRVGATHVGDVIFKGEGVRFVLGEYTKLPTHTTAPDATTERDTKEGEAGRETPDIECIKNLQGLQEAVQSMLVDEQAEFVVSPSHGFGDTDKMPSVRAKGVDKDSSLHMVLRLRAFTKGRETWQMNLDEKVERMVYRKQQGNFFYRRLRGPADIERAIMFYTKALNLFRYDEHLSEEEKGKVNGVRKLCFFNIAQCRFKQKDFGAAIQVSL